MLCAYLVHFADNTLGGIRLAEHTQWRWAALDEIEALDFAGSDRALIPALKAYFGSQIDVNN
ncbi:hypothetical protein AGMMS50293_19980 [Spirochaetia bacterium]|nr:hypothetical protein AGMMS50293_19980 [Spirochaetia bacterium]